MIQRSKAAAVSQMLQFKPNITKVIPFAIVVWIFFACYQMCTLSFAEVPNQGNKKTSEGTSFAAAPGTMVTAESSTVPVQHTMEEPKSPTKVEESEGIVI